MKIVELPMEEIQKDFFFRFTSASDNDRLKVSIRAGGIRTPVHVLPDGKGYRLLSGFRRFEAALELGLKIIPASIVPESTPVEEAFRQVLLEHLVSHPLNLVEKVRVIRILENLELSWESMKKNFFPLFELPQKRSIIQDMMNILSFSPLVQNYIEKYDLSLKQTGMFERLSVSEQDLVVELAMILGIRGVELVEMIEALQDIACGESIPVENILQKSDFRQILESEDISKSQKLNRIKERLNRMRYPRLYSWNDKLKSMQKKMGLPEGQYVYNGVEYESKGGTARYKDGTLIGTASGLSELVRKFVDSTGCGLEAAIRSVTENAAKLLCVDDKKGSIAVGKDADLVLLERDCSVHTTIVGGKIVYQE